MRVVFVLTCLVWCVPLAAEETRPATVKEINPAPAETPKPATVKEIKPAPAEAPKPAPPEDAAAERFRELRNLHRQDAAKAADGFRDFLARYPESDLADDAQYWLAMSLDRSRAKVPDTVAAYRRLIEMYPESNYRSDAYFGVAEVWRRRAQRPEDRTEAIKAYLVFLEKCPKSERVAEAGLKIGECYLDLGKYDKAMESFRGVVADHPESPFVSRARMQLARTHLRRHETDEARAIYAGLLETDLPDDQRIGVRLSMVDCFLGQEDREAGLKKALETCEDIRREAREKKTLEDYAEYKTREKMASFYLRQKQHKEAEAEYEAYIARFGKSAGIWQARLNIGMIRLAAGNPADARCMLHAITSAHPPRPEGVPWYVHQAMYYEAYTYEVEKKWDEARLFYQKLVEHYDRTSWGRRAAEQLKKLEKKPEEPPKPEKKPEPPPKPEKK